MYVRPMLTTARRKEGDILWLVSEPDVLLLGRQFILPALILTVVEQPTVRLWPPQAADDENMTDVIACAAFIQLQERTVSLDIEVSYPTPSFWHSHGSKSKSQNSCSSFMFLEHSSRAEWKSWVLRTQLAVWQFEQTKTHKHKWTHFHSCWSLQWFAVEKLHLVVLTSVKDYIVVTKIRGNIIMGRFAQHWAVSNDQIYYHSIVRTIFCLTSSNKKTHWRFTYYLFSTKFPKTRYADECIHVV